MKVFLPAGRRQGAILPETPQTCSAEIPPVQQFAFPPGLLLQPVPPHVPQLEAQHVVSADTPP